ncbi:MAG: c-type cytochrome [Miltoncostaeaceae bacterium]
MRSRLIATSTALLIIGTAGFLTGCGGAQSALDTADTAAGKTKFVGSCGGCHTLADAGTKGQLGPNLDDAFRASREQGFKETQFYGVVKRWIEVAPQAPLPGSYPQAMPQNLVTGSDAVNVAAYVATAAGTKPTSDVAPLTPAVEGKAPAPGSGPATPADGGATAP